MLKFTVCSRRYYIGLYHARISYTDNDPLVILTFEYEDNPDETAVSVRFMIDHDTLFGTKSEKFIQQRMKAIRQCIDEFIGIVGKIVANVYFLNIINFYQIIIPNIYWI